MATVILVVVSSMNAVPLVRAAEKSGLAPVVIEKVSVTRQLELLGAICEPGQVKLSNGLPVCRSCPSYTSGVGTELRIVNTISGNFTHSGKNELLVDLNGCETNLASDGGSVLLQSGESGWSRTLYLPGFRSNECIRFRNMRLTLSLACSMSSLENGIQSGKLTWLNLFGGKPTHQTLLEWYDNSRSNPRLLRSVFPHRFVKADFNSDGRVDLQVNLRLREEEIPETYPGFVEAIESGYRIKKAEPLRIIYLFDGNTLIPAPTSEAAIKRIDGMIRRARAGDPM